MNVTYWGELLFVILQMFTIVTCVIFEQVQNTKRLKVLQSFHTSSKISCALKCNKNKHDNYRYEGKLCKCLGEHHTSDLHQIQIYQKKEQVIDHNDGYTTYSKLSSER